MRVVLALDRFKGTFSARQVCEILAHGIRERNPNIETILRPLSNGCAGMSEVLKPAMGLESMRVEAPDLFGRRTDAHLHYQAARRLVVIESSELLGASRAIAQTQNLSTASSAGVGTLLMRAMELRPSEIWLSVGGNLCPDLGWGLLDLFGVQALDAAGERIQPCFANLTRVRSLRPGEGVPALFQKIRITVLCESEAPAAQGSPQPLAAALARAVDSVDPSEAQRLLTASWSALRSLKAHIPRDEDAYMGAGLGLPASLAALFPNVKFELGARQVARATALQSSLPGAALVVCGEGALDESTLYGKSPLVVAQLARECHAPVVGLFARCSADAQELARRAGIPRIITLFESPPDVATSDLVRFTRQKLLDAGAELAQSLETGATTA